jgi:chromosome segregation ATPase
LTERDWQRLENTMSFIVDQQAKFEARMEAEAEASKGRMAEFDRQLAASNRRMDRLERFADRTIKAAERRMAKADARLDQAEVERAELRAELKSFLQSIRRSRGNGKSKP